MELPEAPRRPVVPLAVGIVIGFVILAGPAFITTPTTSLLASKLSISQQPDQMLPSMPSFTKPLPDGKANTYYGKYFSQVKQDEEVDLLLQGITGGFFVDSGAYDGVTHSNSLYFEATKGWKGLLVEANPYLYQDIVNRSGRNASVIHACVSPWKQPGVLPFRLAGPLGGLVSEMPSQHQARINSEIGRKEEWMKGAAGSGSDIPVSCWPLASMLQALGVSRVDYWSLDTEGSEAAILAATDFDALDIRVISIEVNDAKAEAKVRHVMAGRPEYKLYKKVALDLVYVKNGVVGLVE